MAKKSASNDAQNNNKHPLTANFSLFAQKTAKWTGHPAAFLLAVTVVVVWIVSGPVFNYSDTWQLVINTGTTVVTFLMVFLIQNTQNRDMVSMQLKLSELVLAMKGAENKYAAIEDLTDDELEELHEDSRKRAQLACDHLEERRKTRESHSPVKKAVAHRTKGDSTKRSQPARKSAKT